MVYYDVIIYARIYAAVTYSNSKIIDMTYFQSFVNFSGKVRVIVAEIRTASGTYNRPVVKLVIVLHPTFSLGPENVTAT